VDTAGIAEIAFLIRVFQSFTVFCRKPNLASSICLRATIFQNPEGTLWTHCITRSSSRRRWYHRDGRAERVSVVVGTKIAALVKLHLNSTWIEATDFFFNNELTD
jgi:hypothetical protein